MQGRCLTWTMMDLQYPGWVIFCLTGNEFIFGCFSVFFGGEGWRGSCAFTAFWVFPCHFAICSQFSGFLRRCEFRLSSGYICSFDFAAFSLLFLVPMSCSHRFTLCSFDFASIFHALVDFAAVPFSWIYNALMLLYSANVVMNISRNEIEKLNRGNGAKCTMFVKFSKDIAET